MTKEVRMTNDGNAGSGSFKSAQSPSPLMGHPSLGMRYCLVLFLTLLLGTQVRADSARRQQHGNLMSRSTRQSIDNGLEFLARHQNRNGSWTDLVGRKVHFRYVGYAADHVGVTALAGMAFLANGSVPGRGKYADTVSRALNYILEHTGSEGFISAHRSRMYSHAFATVFLAEIYGMTQDRKVREKLKLAVRLIVRAQNKEGGWRYLPGAEDSDMSITVCQVMGLRAARNAGIQVPKRSIGEATDYVKRSYRADVSAFTYQVEDNYLRAQSRHSFALTACGVATLYGAGDYDAFQIDEALRYMVERRPRAVEAAQSFDYFYGHYYAAQAAFQKGGSYWSSWYRTIQSEFVLLQESDGSWKDLVGKNYATAMACIVLQIPFQYLPITER